MATSSSSPRELEAQLGYDRQRVGTTLDELRMRLRNSTNVRLQMRRHPDAMVGGAALAGLVMGRLLRRFF